MRGPRHPPAVRFLFVPNVLILIAVSAGPALAQVTGKVIGTVTDGDTGLPLVGAQVAVEGTNLGNVTDRTVLTSSTTCRSASGSSPLSTWATVR